MPAVCKRGLIELACGEAFAAPELDWGAHSRMALCYMSGVTAYTPMGRASVELETGAQVALSQCSHMEDY